MKSIKVCEYSRSRSFHDDLILQDQASGERSQDHWSSVVFFFLGETSNIVGCFCGFVVPGAPECSTGRLVFVVFGEARDRTCDPWFKRRVT